MLGIKEIYLGDLKENIQKEVLEYMGLKNASDDNLDITPLFVLESSELENP